MIMEQDRQMAIDLIEEAVSAGARRFKACERKAAEAWREHFEALPRPVTALLVGGQTKPFRFDADAARGLLD